MSDLKPSLALVEALYRALKFLQLYPADDPKARQTLKAAEEAVLQLQAAESGAALEVSPQSKLLCNGQPLDARGQAVGALAQLLRERRISRVAFQEGVDGDDLQLLFFVLQLPPQRLEELGGPTSFAEEFNHIALGEAPVPAARAEAPAFALGAPPALEPFRPEEIPTPPEPPPPPALPVPDLADALRLRFAPLALEARRSPLASAHLPWSQEQMEALRHGSVTFADLGALVGTGEELKLNQTDPITLRNALRQALALLPSGAQGAVLLGIPTIPGTEQALRRALDYLAPELMAQAAAEVHAQLKLSTTALALLVSALMQCVRDRDLSLEALRGRLQFEGWDLEGLDELQAAILWECQGTDTKLREAIQARGILDMEVSQVINLVRQALRQGRAEDLARLLAPLEAGLFSPKPKVRRQAAELLANLADCLEDPGLPDEAQSKVLDLLHAHLNHEQEVEALQWSTHAMEALLSHGLGRGQFAEAYRIVLALLDLASANAHGVSKAWKAQAIQDLLVRLAGPLNMAALVPLLHQKRGDLSTPQVHSLLGVMGQPAARYLVVCLGIEEDRSRRTHLLDALRAIGKPAIGPLRGALGAPEWYLVRNAVMLLGEIGDPDSCEDVAATLQHRDARVRRIAARTMAKLDPTRSVPVLAMALASADPGSRLELLALLGELKDPRAAGPISDLLANLKPQGEEAERIRLRAIETLGVLGASEGVPALARIFKRRGLLQSKENLGIRLAAARSLASIGTREAREAMAIAIEDESREEVRTILRQFLVGGA